MSTATRPQHGGRPQSQQQSASSLLDQILEQPVSERMRAVSDALEKRIHTVEEVLPDSLKTQAARLVKRAELTFNRKADLHECTPPSLVRCVVEAAEIGLAIDGKLCYAVAYNRNIAPKGARPQWIKEAQLQIDYKGLIVVARRSGQIIDAYGDVVCEGDRFEAYRKGPESVLNHSYDFGTVRGNVIGAYALILFDRDRWRYEMMPVEEIEAIRQRSKSKDSGPWVTDVNQMRIKTVLRRGLKLYCDDPAVGMAIEIDEREYEGERSDQSRPAPRVGRSALNDTLAAPQKTVDSIPGRSNHQRITDMEQHFGGAPNQPESEPTPDADQSETGPDWAAIKRAFSKADSDDAVAAIYEECLSYSPTPDQGKEIEAWRQEAQTRVSSGKGKKQKEIE